MRWPVTLPTTTPLCVSSQGLQNELEQLLRGLKSDGTAVRINRFFFSELKTHMHADMHMCTSKILQSEQGILILIGSRHGVPFFQVHPSTRVFPVIELWQHWFRLKNCIYAYVQLLCSSESFSPGDSCRAVTLPPAKHSTFGRQTGEWTHSMFDWQVGLIYCAGVQRAHVHRKGRRHSEREGWKLEAAIGCRARIFSLSSSWDAGSSGCQTVPGTPCSFYLFIHTTQPVTGRCAAKAAIIKRS